MLHHQLNGHPIAVLLPDYRSVMRVVGCYFSDRDFVTILIGHRNHLFDHGFQFTIVQIEEFTIFFFDGYQVMIDHVGAARGMHPSAVLVEALVDKELTPCYCSVCVQALFRYHFQFRTEIE